MVRDKILELLKEGPKSFNELKEALEQRNVKASVNYLHHILWELQDYGLVERKIIYKLKEQR